MNDLHKLVHSQGFDSFVGDNEWMGVCTPYVFASGRPAVYYAKQQQNTLQINDHGLNLRLFELCLPDPSKALKTMQRLVENSSHNVHFKNGLLTLEYPMQDAQLGLGEYLSVLSRLTTHAPNSVEKQDFQEILEILHSFLRAKHGDILAVDPTVQGHSGHKYHWNFQAGARFIDYAKPEPKKTGQLLRKMIDIQNGMDGAQFQIILDDQDKASYKREGEILSSVASIMPKSIVLGAKGLLH